MKKIEMIRAIIIMQEMKIISNKVYCYGLIKEIIKNMKYKNKRMGEKE